MTAQGDPVLTQYKPLLVNAGNKIQKEEYEVRNRLDTDSKDFELDSHLHFATREHHYLPTTELNVELKLYVHLSGGKKQNYK